MPVPQREDILDALKDVAAILRAADIEFALGGGLAAWARGGPPTEHDVDLAIREPDAERALDALRAAGLRTGRPPEGWLVKAWVGDVLVDLVYRPSNLDIDDDFFTRCTELSVAALPMPVMSATDLFKTKLLALSEHDLDLEPLLVYARALREQVDWPDVMRSVEHSPFARCFIFLAAALRVVPTVALEARLDDAPRLIGSPWVGGR